METFRKMFIRLTVIFLCLILIGLNEATADTLFSDNFNSENSGVQADNYYGFSNWDVTRGSVDIITYNSVFNFLGTGVYVDLDGSTWAAGRMETKTTFDLLPGDYTLEFIAAGNNRGRPTDVVTVSVGSVLSETLIIEPGEPLGNRQFSFHVDSLTTGKIVFDHQGNDNCGIIVDDITLNGPPQVPEPTTILLLGLGLVGLVGARKKWDGQKMRKLVSILSITIVLGFTTLCNASLIGLGNGINKDDRGTTDALDDMYWIADTASFVGYAYDQQKAMIAALDVTDYALNVLGITSFHMATSSDVHILWNNIDADILAALFTSTAIGDPTDDAIWWALRYDKLEYINGQSPYEGNYFHAQTLLAYYINGGYAEKRANNSIVWDESLEPGAWAVAYYVPPVQTPEPATMLLLGVGLIGLTGVRIRLEGMK